ncbi:hypothetical protein [Actinophytocola glycyrrhizae]|uniref:Uncharacterized protein n=1 Tax=Actinophytocola glycyrrhizae TaxID=2044873 RepID=A0ABV9S878_9PSEU
MSKLSKLAARTLVTLAGAGSLLFAATSVAALSEIGPAQGEVSVVADSPWDHLKP